ncbi:MAG: stage II sporulation protein M [Bacilli bacterium]
MRMNLKNKSLKKFKIKKVKLSAKNLFIFLLSFSIITIIIGIIFYFLLSSKDKETVNSSINGYFTIKDNYNYISLLKDNILDNTYDTFLIWILGISVIGVIASIFIYFCELFSIGFTIASIMNVYDVKGLIGVLCYLIPTKICYIIVLFILTFFAVKISYKLIKLCFTKEEVNIKLEISKYFKVLLFSFIVMIAISMLTVFIDPLLIKVFTSF